MSQKKSLEDELYILGWIFLIIGGIGAVLYLKLVVPNVPMFPCVLYTCFGIYCPGCGGTRALEAFMKGDFLHSLWYHPLILYTVVLFGGFMLTQTLERLRFPKVKGWKFHAWQLYGAVVILFLNMIIKNILLRCYNITL